MNPALFPPLYHAHHGAYTEDLPYWLDLASRASDPLLELGCGSGRILRPLAEAGHAVWGVDNDPEMLAFLQANLPAELLINQVTLLTGDMTNLAALVPPAAFDLAILPCNTLSTLPEPARAGLFDGLHHALRPGGIFAVSLPNPPMLRDLPSRGQEEIEETFNHPLTGNPVQVSSSWQRSKTHFRVRWHYDHLLPDGQIERFSAEVRHSLDPAEAYLHELDDAGLHIRGVYSDFARSAYDPEGEMMVIETERGS